MYTIRKSEAADIPRMLEIIAEAQAAFREQGIDQWQDGYPNKEVLLQDIEAGDSYVVLDEQQIVATAMISFDGDPNYKLIIGAWKNDLPYVVVHRIAVATSQKGKGIAGLILDFARSMCKERGVKCMRIDTHVDNHAMQRSIEKFGYYYCGIVFVRDGSERLAFELLI